MKSNFYVDETKAKGYIVAAACGPDVGMAVLRKEVRNLLAPAQRSIHMKAEHKTRKALIADAIAGLVDQGVEVTVYDAGRQGTERTRRRRCLEQLVDDVARHDEAHVVFDLDETLRRWDRQQMIDLLGHAGAKGRVTYDHAHRHHEMMLAVPDVVAWCWAAGGDWRRRVEPIVVSVRTLS